MTSYSYNPVTPEIIEALAAICGSDAVIHDDPDALRKFSHDEVPEARYAHMPDVVVAPSDTEAVAAVMKLANSRRIAVTPRAAGTGLSGGAVPAYGGILLSIARMDRIIEIDPANLMAVVEPGVVTNRLDAALRPHGLFFAGYPMSEEISFIAGNVAENAGGGRAVKYGVTGRYIHGLEVVTPLGDVVHLGGKRVKDVTGYDLVHLMVGSEGTLGIFTKIVIRLLPRPSHRTALLVLFDSVERAIAMVSRVMIEGRLIPSAAEFMDGFSFQRAAESLKRSFPFDRTAAALLFEVDGNREAAVARDAETILALCRENGAIFDVTAATEQEVDDLWKIRKRIVWVLKRHSPQQCLEDIVVPIAGIPELVPKLQAIGDRYDIRIPVYGHAADGNLHATPVKNPEHTDAQWEQMQPKLLSDIYRLTAELGGTISGEHGIGHKRRDFLDLVMSQPQIEIMRAIKRALDPNNILNPGKIFMV